MSFASIKTWAPRRWIGLGDVSEENARVWQLRHECQTEEQPKTTAAMIHAGRRRSGDD